jgi:hypothetical protein
MPRRASSSPAQSRRGPLSMPLENPPMPAEPPKMIEGPKAGLFDFEP